MVGRPDDIKGQAVAALVTLEGGVVPNAGLKEELRAWVAKEIGAMAKPDDIRFTDQLPKTRSGKILRKTMRGIADGQDEPIPSTIEDPAVLSALRPVLADSG